MALFTMTKAARAMGLGLLLVALAGCAENPGTGSNTEVSSPAPAPSAAPATSAVVPDREPHTLVLNATGSGNITSIKYTLDGREVQRGAGTLPWRESVTVPADGQPHSYSLEVEFKGTGKVELVAIFDGKVVATGGSSGSGGNTTGVAAVGGTVNG
jgi:hypothetical protein